MRHRYTALISPALALVAFTLAAGPADAQMRGREKGTFGVGLILGEPTGVSAKLYLDGGSNFAVAGAAGLAALAGGIHAHVDGLWHPWILTDEDKFVLPAYVGAGLRLLDHDRGDGAGDFHIGVRGVVGLVFDFYEIPLDAFLEVAGVLDQRSGGGDDNHRGLAFMLNLGAGARYYF